jgi:putative tricarboxylic transport membrane protein
MAEGVKPSQEGPRSDLSLATNPLRGGIIVTVLALLLFLSAFSIDRATVMFTLFGVNFWSTTVPQILALLVAATGVAVMAGFIKVRGPQDFYGGLVLVLLAILALVASAELPGQRGFAFGPGTAPRLFSCLLAGVGAAVAVVGATADGPPIEKYKIYGPTLVVIAICLFAALIRPFGLVIATYTAFIVSIMGSTEMRWIESIIGAAVMTAFCWLLFVVLLNLPFQLWPQSNGPEILLHQFEDIFKQTWIILQKLVPILR